MTFIIGYDKLLERPIKDVSRIVAHLYITNDLDRLNRLRGMLLKEQLEMVDTFKLPPGHLDQMRAQVRGIQWRLDIEMNQCEDDKERLALLAARFWDGCSILNAVNDRNTGTGGYPPRKED